MGENDNVFRFQGPNMIVSAKGPNINNNFTMDTNFRPNLLSSTMNMPRNFEKQSSAASVASSQRSIYNGRKTSPTASVHSDMQPRNFHQPFYSRGYSQRSVYNDRALSPASLRSIDSTVSRADIVIDAIKSCTEDEWEKIWHVVNRKHEFRKKAQKRRNMKMFLKNLRNRSEDEGEQGSHSSNDNDDCMSTQTGYRRRYRYDPYSNENIPRSVNSYDCRSEDMYRSSNKDGYSGYSRTDLQNPYHDNSAYRPANMFPYQKQAQFGPMYFSQRSVLPQNNSALHTQNNTMTNPKNTFSKRYAGHANMSIQRNTLNGSICSTKSMQNMTMMSQRDRFRGGFQFSSQNFNRSTLFDEQEQVRNKQFPMKDCANKEKNMHRESDVQSDENDDIFLDTTAKPKTATKKSGKRKAENFDDIPKPSKKKPKTILSNEKFKNKTQNKDNKENNEFEFVKPQFPVRKTAPAKPREKMISKSSGAPDLIFSTPDNENPRPQPEKAPSPEPEPEQQEIPELTTSDLSLRPSFMKRKLFTQTLDVTERKNNSFDSGSADSPQNNIYSALSREKHKTRKLVTSQSLLSRDVNQDDDNYLDLIHKIVPPNQVNSTITVNTTKSRVSETKNGEDKWDITSIISTCNNDSVSETYTDDEIFRVGNDDTKSNAQEKVVIKKHKQNEKTKLSNKLESNEANNDEIPFYNKNFKDDDGDVGAKNNKNIGNMKLAINKNNKIGGNVNQTNILNDEDVRNTKTTNIKDIGDIKLTNKKPAKDSNAVKPASNKNVKEMSNTKTANHKDIKEMGKTKHKNNKSIKVLSDIKLPYTKNSKTVENINRQTNKSVKDMGNKHNTSSKNDTDIMKALQVAPKMDTPVKLCPAKRVMIGQSGLDAFWDTDVSDSECAGARRDFQRTFHHQDVAQNHVSRPNKSGPSIHLSTKQTSINQIQALSPLVMLQDVAKVRTKQASKIITNKTQPKTVKDKGYDKAPPGKGGKIKSETTNTSMRTRRLVNLSETLDSVNNSDINEKDTSLKDTVTTKTDKKQRAEKKGTQDKSNKTKPTAESTKSRNKKQNGSLIDNSNKRVETPKSQPRSKTSKLQKPNDHISIGFCKVLRSRNIDLSSSFNSDNFELTMSRTRKSRTPSKRSSFNKSKIC